MRVSRLAVLMVVLSAASNAQAQDAVEWFGKAVYTTNADEQIAYYRKALEVDPNYHQAAHNLAGVYYRKGHVHRSISLYEQLIRNSRAYYQTFYNLACCYARVGDQEHALKALTRAFQKGFHDRKLVERDEDLAEVRTMPQYAQLAARYLGERGGHRAVPAPAAGAVGGADGAGGDVAAAAKIRTRKPKKARPAPRQLADAGAPSAGGKGSGSGSGKAGPKTGSAGATEGSHPAAQHAQAAPKPRAVAAAVATESAIEPVEAGVVVKK